MADKTAQLGKAIKNYPELKGQFDEFCIFAAGGESSFAFEDGGTKATFRLLGEEFIIRFHTIVKNDVACGVLKVNLALPADEEHFLWHIYFNRTGGVGERVSDLPNAATHLASKEFFQMLCSGFSDCYFTYMSKTLDQLAVD